MFWAKDNYGNVIRLNESNDIISAYYITDKHQEYAGEIQFLVINNCDKFGNESTSAYIQLANVLPLFQRRGIATQIIIYAKKLYDNVLFAPDLGYGGKSDGIHYSDAGLALKNSCERKGITNAIEL